MQSVFAGAIVYFVSSDLETALKNILRLLPVFDLPFDRLFRNSVSTGSLISGRCTCFRKKNSR